jgi:hypothetical protein
VQEIPPLPEGLGGISLLTEQTMQTRRSGATIAGAVQPAPELVGI